jgi:hypothetical protein
MWHWVADIMWVIVVCDLKKEKKKKKKLMFLDITFSLLKLAVFNSLSNSSILY